MINSMMLEAVEKIYSSPQLRSFIDLAASTRNPLFLTFRKRAGNQGFSKNNL